MVTQNQIVLLISSVKTNIADCVQTEILRSHLNLFLIVLLILFYTINVVVIVVIIIIALLKNCLSYSVHCHILAGALTADADETHYLYMIITDIPDTLLWVHPQYKCKILPPGNDCSSPN